MAVRPISVKMDDALIAKLDAVAKANHRKRSPEINVAVEFYLKYHQAGIETNLVKVQETTKKDDTPEVNTKFNVDEMPEF